MQVAIDAEDRAGQHGAAQAHRDVDPIRIEHCIPGVHGFRQRSAPRAAYLVAIVAPSRRKVYTCRGAGPPAKAVRQRARLCNRSYA